MTSTTPTATPSTSQQQPNLLYVKGGFRDRASRRGSLADPERLTSLLGLSTAAKFAKKLSTKLEQKKKPSLLLQKVKEHKRNVGGYTVCFCCLGPPEC